MRRLDAEVRSFLAQWRETVLRRWVLAKEARDPERSLSDITADVVREERRELLSERLNNNE